MAKLGNAVKQSGWLCWLLKIIVVGYWLLIPTGFYKGVIHDHRESVRQRKVYSPVITKQHNEAYRYLADRLVKRAKQEGRRYSPKCYFADLKALYEKLESYQDNKPLWVPSFTNRLQAILDVNRAKGIYSDAEIIAERESFNYWHQGQMSHVDEAKQDLHRMGLRGVVQWLWLFYLNSLWLVFILFALRMMQRRGILAAILADKKAFIKALLFFPYYLGKYPHNVVREIRVEAELRRLGGLFRILKPQERQTVREIANSASYGDWLNWHRHHAGYRRHVVLTVLVTVLMNLILPVSIQADSSKRRRSEVSIKISNITVRAGPTQFRMDCGSTNGSDDKTSDHIATNALLPEKDMISSVLLWWSLPLDRPLELPLRAFVIEHIPIQGLDFWTFVSKSR